MCNHCFLFKSKPSKQFTKGCVARKKQRLDLNSDLIFNIINDSVLMTFLLLLWNTTIKSSLQKKLFYLKVPEGESIRLGSHGQSRKQRDNIFNCRKAAAITSRKWGEAITIPQTNLSDVFLLILVLSNSTTKWPSGDQVFKHKSL